MCKRFEDGLNEDIKMFVGVLEIQEFVVLVERACKAEELRKEKKKLMWELESFVKDPRESLFNRHRRNFEMMWAGREALRAFLDEIVIDPLWVHEALRSPVLGMNVETERNVDIAVNGIRGVVDSLTAPVTSADQLTTSLKIARGCLNRM